MPASEVMSLYRQHKLHSGPGGPVVKKKKQAVAIQISMARKEGHDIPEKKSFQYGGLVPEGGHHPEDPRVPGYQQKQPPKNPKWLYNTGAGTRTEDTGLAAQAGAPEYVIKSAPTMRHNWPEHEPIMRHGGAPVPPARRYEEAPRPSAQAQDIASRTRGAEESAYQAAMHSRHVPGEGTTVPGKNDPVYAIRGLQGNIAQRMHEQGERGSFRGGGHAGSGRYLVHEGEMVTDSTGGADPGRALVPERGYRHERSFQGGGGAGGGGGGGGSGGGEGGGGGGESGTSGDSGGGAMPDAYRASAPAATTSIQNISKWGAHPGGPGLKGKAPEQKGGPRPNPELEAMRANVAGPLARSSSSFDSPASSFKHGGIIPRTGIYRLHAGEHVIPKSLAGRYREMKTKWQKTS